ncbi:MAG: hypothetical protein OXH33_00005, partial [bacterium]|nr:hypothetical protein [bacterium]
AKKFSRVTKTPGCTDSSIAVLPYPGFELGFYLGIPTYLPGHKEGFRVAVGLYEDNKMRFSHRG